MRQNDCVFFVSVTIVLVPPFLHYYTNDCAHDMILISDSRYDR